jgi:hypothetical protein
MKNIDNEQYVSLYDYSGSTSRQSGIGQQVYNAAKEKGIHVIYTDIPEALRTSEYNRVATYPKSFLDEYFGKTTSNIKSDISTLTFKELYDRLVALEDQFAELIKKLEPKTQQNVTNSNERDDELPF